MNDVQMLELSFRSFYEQAQELEAKGDFISARKAYLLAAQQMARLAEANKGTELSKAQQGRAATILEHAQLVEEWAKKQREYLKNHPPAPRRPKNIGNEEGNAGSVGNSGPSELNDGGKQWVSAKKPDVTFDDVIGLEHAKREIFQNFIDPIRHPEVFRSYGLKGGKGLLLYGPPGTGPRRSPTRSTPASTTSARATSFRSGSGTPRRTSPPFSRRRTSLGPPSSTSTTARGSCAPGTAPLPMTRS